MYNYGYDYSSTADSMAGYATAMLGLGAAMFIFSAIIALIAIISYAKIFKKAGKPWWAILVPIYNTIVMIEIAKLPMWYIALFFIPIANIYAIFKINIEIAKKFGKSTGFGIGMTLISIIFIPMLAFSDNTYEENESSVNTVKEQFDATSVINDNENSNVTINEVPVAPIEVNNSVDINGANEEVVNTFNPEPTVTPVETVQENVQTLEEVNAFNAEPMVAPVEPVQENVENIEQNTNIETFDTLNVESTINEPQINVMGDTTKKCKNCGNELPDIVSICPNCGTDNE